jgi:hypothetical protein
MECNNSIYRYIKENNNMLLCYYVFPLSCLKYVIMLLCLFRYYV